MFRILSLDGGGIKGAFSALVPGELVSCVGSFRAGDEEGVSR